MAYRATLLEAAALARNVGNDELFVQAALANYRTEAPHARDAHPTDEHFLPLHVAFGAAGKGAHGKPLHRSFTSGNLSMAAYSFS